MKQKEEILNQIRNTIDFFKSAKEERQKELDNLLYGCNVSKIEDIDGYEAYHLGFELEHQINELDYFIDELERQSRHISEFEEV